MQLAQEVSPFASIDELQRRYQGKLLTVEAVVDLFLRRIEAYDKRGPSVNTVVTINPRATHEARLMDSHRNEGRAVGPLHGVPILVKDQIETAGLETCFGSVAMRGYLPARDATVVARLKRAGAIVLAKTTMPDFAASWFSLSSRSGSTRCPYDLSRDAGGSSSGSAAGVAAGFATVGIGEDTGGSVRVPAAFNNLVGMRVTPGLISRHGMSPLVASQDTAGPLTRTVEDAASLLDVLVGYDPNDPRTNSASQLRKRPPYRASLRQHRVRGMRIGVLVEAFGDDPGGAPVRDVVWQALQRMSLAGATIVPVSIGQLSRHIRETSLYLSTSRDDINGFLRGRPVPHRDLESIVAQGLFEPSLDLLRAIATTRAYADEQERRSAQDRFQRLLLESIKRSEVMVLCFPTVPVCAPTPEELRTGAVTTEGFPTNTVIAAQSGLPALSLPAGLTPTGLPVGMELMAGPHQEALLLALGADLQRINPPYVVPSATP